MDFIKLKTLGKNKTVKNFLVWKNRTSQSWKALYKCMSNWQDISVFLETLKEKNKELVKLTRNRDIF